MFKTSLGAKKRERRENKTASASMVTHAHSTAHLERSACGQDVRKGLKAVRGEPQVL